MSTPRLHVLLHSLRQAAGRTDEPGAAKLDATEFDETLKALDEFK